MGGSSTLILQISDTHLYKNPQHRLLGLNTQDSLAEILKQVQSENKIPDVVLLTGDLSQDCSTSSYKRLAKMMEIFICPIYWIPGNHDSPALMKKIFAKTHLLDDKHIVINNWQLILLDSHKPGSTSGSLGREQIHFLNNNLQNSFNYYSLITLHHHCIPSGSGWLDTSILENREEFLKIVMLDSNVKAILSGHIHQKMETVIQGKFFYSCPSTCIQFKQNSQKFSLDNVSPGYRWLELMSDGTVRTEVKRLENFQMQADENAKGY